MKIFPKGKFTWLLVILMIYAYYNEYVVDKKPLPVHTSTEPSNIAVINKDEADKTSAGAAKQESELSARIIDKVRENETGKVILEAIVKKTVQEKYGTDDIKVIATRETGALTIIDSLKGQGAVLNCGAEAVINYDAFMSSGMKFDSTKTQEEQRPVTIQLGGGQVIKGLEMGLLGMHEGGKRKISIPSSLAFGPGFTNTIISKDEVISYDVELVEIKDGPYKTGLVPTVMSVTEGAGDKITCGEKIKIKYAFSSLEATPVPETSGEVEFKLGGGTIPMGVEFALLDMKKGGRKTIQMPHELIKTAKASILPSQLNFDSDEIIKAEIEILDIAAN